jgi:tRNA (cmo5U34)-methyltransferase
MSEFDLKAAGWDQNPMHWERSAAFINELLKRVPVTKEMTALEFGAGTGITSFLLKDHLKEITMLDSSAEMVKIMNEKIKAAKINNLKALFFDLEKDPWRANKFDLIITQMVLHHVADIENIIGKFYNLLNPGGFLAIADLFPEDGSFHGEGFTGHKGFKIEELSIVIKKHGFANITSRNCFVINKKISDSKTKNFGVFLLIANRENNKLPGNLVL